jgi:hypothetical protein
VTAIAIVKKRERDIKKEGEKERERERGRERRGSDRKQKKWKASLFFFNKNSCGSSQPLFLVCHE